MDPINIHNNTWIIMYANISTILPMCTKLLINNDIYWYTNYITHIQRIDYQEWLRLGYQPLIPIVIENYILSIIHTSIPTMALTYTPNYTSTMIHTKIPTTVLIAVINYSSIMIYTITPTMALDILVYTLWYPQMYIITHWSAMAPVCASNCTPRMMNNFVTTTAPKDVTNYAYIMIIC